MRFKIVTLVAAGLVLSTALAAFDENGIHSFLIKVKGQQELETLKKMHQFNEIFDNYHFGGISPDIPTQKGK